MSRNTCFVTCASSHNITWLKDCLNSIKNNTTYGNIAHMIIDIGFTSEDKIYLKTKYPQIDFVAPTYEYLPISHHGNLPGLANHQYPFFCDLLKDFDHIIHIEADVWIIDQTVIERFLEGITYSEAIMCNFNSGFFIIKNRSQFSENWRNYYIYKISRTNNFFYALQEICLNHVVTKSGIPRIEKFDTEYKHNFTPFQKGIPLIDGNDKKTLRDPLTFRKLTSIHVQKSCFGVTNENSDFDRFCYHVPTFEAYWRWRQASIYKHLQNLLNPNYVHNGVYISLRYQE